MNDHELIDRRVRALGAGYETFYDAPIHFVRGEGVALIDAAGRDYLDCYNNVPSVGHCHPKVVEAICTQARQLNTHTRYLHEKVVELAERLGQKLGDDLSACWLTCTGTEANDLAVQIARQATGQHGVIVFEGSYHGNSTLVHDLSPEGTAQDDRPDWVIAVEPPNTYRGPYLEAEPDHSASYAALVDDACVELRSRGHGVAALLVDTSWDANGVIIPPDGFLPQVASSVRAAGGLVIADEVQAGYCRLGDRWWGHQRYGLTPDIVTMGKPMGGGHPVAACVTTPDISAEFGSKRSYFNTFGGNPVSAAAALAVIDVIEEEGLLDNATSTGAYLGEQLQALATKHSIIGNVSGSGLFWGVDLITDQNTRQPVDAAVVASLISDIASHGVLMGSVGRFGNIVKIRPPLPFGRPNVDHALAVLDDRLSALGGDREGR